MPVSDNAWENRHIALITDDDYDDYDDYECLGEPRRTTVGSVITVNFEVKLNRSVVLLSSRTHCLDA